MSNQIKSSIVMPPPDIRPPIDPIKAILGMLAAFSMFLMGVCWLRERPQTVRVMYEPANVFRVADLQVDNNTALGSSPATNTVTVLARETLTSTNGTTHAYLSTLNPTAATTDSIAAVRASNTGTYNTTAGALETTGIKSTVTATRSGGGNNLSNIAGNFSSSGAQINIGVRTDLGSNYFNTGNGNSGFGTSVGATLNSKVVVTGGSTSAIEATSTGVTFSGTATPAARTSTLTAAVTNTLAGTFDTSAGALTAESARFLTTSTRSAGANTLTNRALFASAAGGQTNIAFETSQGDDFFNVSSGNSAFGVASGTSITGQKVRIDGVGSNQSLLVNSAQTGVTSGLTVSNIQNTATYDTTAGALQTNAFNSNCAATRSAGANALTCVAARLQATGAQTNIALNTIQGDTYLSTTSGNVGIGLSLGGAITGKFHVANTTTNIGGRIATSVTGSTAAGTGFQGSVSGTYDTTAGVLNSVAEDITATSTRSAGANNLTNIGTRTTATGAQINAALQTVDGDVYLNSSSGNSAVGVSMGSTLNSKFTMSNTTRSQGAIFSSTGGLTTTSNLIGLNSANTGSLDTTAGGLSSTAGTFSVTTTRSAGANTLTNTAGLFDASGGQDNRALQTNSGDVRLNATSGALMIGSGTFRIVANGSGPSLSTGAAGAGSRTWWGNVTGAAATTVTITYASAFSTTSWCHITGNGTPQFYTVTRSASAPVVSCFAPTTGVAATCQDFTYECVGQ